MLPTSMMSPVYTIVIEVVIEIIVEIVVEKFEQLIEQHLVVVKLVVEKFVDAEKFEQLNEIDFLDYHMKGIKAEA